MASLFEEINNLENWNYYTRENKFQIETIDNWNLDKKHKNFIENFLKLSGKIEIISFFHIELDKFTRATHTNSVFFLGCLFYEKLGFKDKINFKREERDEFNFIWFLTSLIHDFGYDIENNRKRYEKVTKNIESLKKDFDIKEDLLKQPLDSYSKNMKELIDYIPEYYEKRFDGTIGRDKNGKIDHGIASGLILYNSLVKNRKDKKDKYGEIDIKHNLYWGEDLDLFYATSSYSIAIHNIRSKNQDLKFSIKDDPFLFLLWIADTLEPTKCFECCNPQYVLENIDIEFNSNKNGFTIKNKQNSELDFSKYKKNIKGLTNFLNIKTNIENINEFVLSW